LEIFVNRRVRVLVLVGVVSMAGALLTSSPAAAETPLASGSARTVTKPSPSPVDAPSAATSQSASTIAVRFGHPVAVDAETTPTTQVSALPDGTMQLVTDALPVRQGGRRLGRDQHFTQESA
jgi:hypothetical protein